MSDLFETIRKNRKNEEAAGKIEIEKNIEKIKKYDLTGLSKAACYLLYERKIEVMKTLKDNLIIQKIAERMIDDYNDAEYEKYDPECDPSSHAYMIRGVANGTIHVNASEEEMEKIMAEADEL
jgi:hypothetical protein